MLSSQDGMGKPEVISIGDSKMAWNPVWSPDGKKIAFLRMGKGECGIQVMPALGGQASLVLRLLLGLDATAALGARVDAD